MFKRRKKKPVSAPTNRLQPTSVQEVNRAKIEEVSHLASQLLNATKGMESIMLQIRNNSISLMEIASKVAQGHPISPDEEKTIHQTNLLLSKAAIQDMMKSCTDQDMKQDTPAKVNTNTILEINNNLSTTMAPPVQIKQPPTSEKTSNQTPAAVEVNDPSNIDLDDDGSLAVELDWDTDGIELSESMELGSYVPSLSSGYNSKDLSPYSPFSDYNLTSMTSTHGTIPEITSNALRNTDIDDKLRASAIYDSIYEEFMELSLEDEDFSDMPDLREITDEPKDIVISTCETNLLSEKREWKTTPNGSLTSLHYDKMANPWNMYSCFQMDDIRGSVQSILSERKGSPANNNTDIAVAQNSVAPLALKSWNDRISRFTKGRQSFLPSVLRYPAMSNVNRRSVFV